jgi:hypothetical protein
VLHATMTVAGTARHHASTGLATLDGVLIRKYQGHPEPWMRVLDAQPAMMQVHSTMSDRQP